jgi:6-hydroxycyclohex-1-ene-1-carbonyl-CoA dehydrogenase
MPDAMVAWQMVEPGRPLELTDLPMPKPGSGEVLLEVRGAGLCHTDVSFLYGGVRTNHPLPLTLGHEIVGRAIATGDGVESALGQSYIVPAVLPCGECELCHRDRGNICRAQKMPGNDFPGGFASHFVTPARFLCPVPGDTPDIPTLSVVADAVSTAYQSVLRANVGPEGLVVVVGVGGVGTYAAQTAKARGASVVGIDVEAGRLERLGRFVDLPLMATEGGPRELRKAVEAFERERELAPTRRVVLECSGTAAGQETAYSLLTFAATLGIVGFTLDRVPVRLANLMAFDATVFGNWGCLPRHYPEILRHIRDGQIVLEPFVEPMPMSRLNELLREEGHSRRPVLIPDFGR